MLVGGRIVPSFTHNWLAKTIQADSRNAFSRYDAVAS